MENHIKELTIQFEIVKEKISQNLTKLHIGVIKKNVENLIKRILDDGLKKIKQNLMEQLMRVQRDIKDKVKTDY